MAQSNETFKTKTSHSDFAIVVYPWRDNYLDAGMEEGNPYLLDIGPHFVSFSRSKDIGGTLQIESYGVGDTAEIGDWIVLKTFSKRRISRKSDDYRKEGRVKFIGQVYSKNVTHFSDADGNLRTNTQYTVREWSHIFHMQVKVDQMAISANAEEGSSQGVLGRIELSSGSNATRSEASKRFEDFINEKYNPFNLTAQMLEFIGGLSANDRRNPQKEVANLFSVTHRLPIVPEQLFEENILPWTSPEGNTDRFDKQSPWSTGFFWWFLGVQQWASGKKSYEATFRSPDSLWDQLTLISDTRPASLTNPIEYAIGYSFIEALMKQFGDAGLYDIYTDLVYFEDEAKCAPALFVRDRPVSFRRIYDSASAQQLEGEFGWTYFDDIPRTEIDPASVISITFNSNASDSANYIRYNLESGVFKDNNAKALSTKYGVYVNTASQRKFGTVEDERIIHSYISPELASRISKGESKNVADLRDSSFENWFKALSTKSGNYYPFKFMFPNANVLLKDDDYPITVGMAIRIKLQNTVLVGFVESVNTFFRMQEDGKKTNEVYVELTDCSMEDSDGNLMPMPRKLINNFVRHVVTPDEKQRVLDTWRFQSKTFDFSIPGV